MTMPYCPDKLLAFGTVTGAGVFVGRGAAVARTGAGVYTITLPADAQKDTDEKIVNVTPRDAAGALANVTADTDQVTTVTTYTLPAGLAAGPVAADHDWRFEIRGVDFA
jgi:hypothetical protein